MSRKLVLQDFLPYLVNRAGLKVGLMFSRDIDHLDVTLPMWRVMIELWHRGDHRLGELAERTSIDLSTLSRLLVTMQKRRLIVRRRSGLDRRALSLTLTERGLELTERIAPYALRYEDVLMRGMSAAEVRQLKRLLKTMFANLDAAGQAAARTPRRTAKTSSAKTSPAKTPSAKTSPARTPASKTPSAKTSSAKTSSAKTPAARRPRRAAR